jgi:hypothetical protein
VGSRFICRFPAERLVRAETVQLPRGAAGADRSAAG